MEAAAWATAHTQGEEKGKRSYMYIIWCSIIQLVSSYRVYLSLTVISCTVRHRVLDHLQVDVKSHKPSTHGLEDTKNKIAVVKHNMSDKNITGFLSIDQ